MEPRLTGVPSGWAGPTTLSPYALSPQSPPTTAPMGDIIIRRCLASGSTMDGDRSGLRLMFPWERVLPIPCPSSGVLLGNATWVKEAPIPFLPESSVKVTRHNTWPQGRQDCVSKVRLQVRDPGNPKLGRKPHSIHPPVPIRLHTQPCPSWYPRDYRMGYPQAPSIPSLWKHSAGKSANRPTTHPPYAMLTWTPVLPEKQAVCMYASVWRVETQSHILPGA